MSHNNYSHASTSSRANGPVPRQQPDRPVRFVRMSDVEQRLEEAERIRGGCCMCFGGSIWVCGWPWSDEVDAKYVRDARTSNSPISPTAISFSSSHPSQASPAQSRRATADDAEQQASQPNLVSRPGRVSFSPSPPHSPRSPSQPHRRPTKAPSTHSGVSEPTAVEPSISGHTEVGSGPSITSEKAIASVKAPRALWGRLRDSIFNRPGQGEQQQNASDNRRNSISLGWYELTVDWD